jgi:4a-hydroxytetrahydrobiopterin dehydratase
MSTQPSQPLVQQHCKPCEGGVPKLTTAQSEPLLLQIPHWRITPSGDAITRSWKLPDFVSAIELLDRIAQLAEQQQHHPDLHLTGYRHLRVELTTHAIGGLSENDFILAAKIDALAGP